MTDTDNAGYLENECPFHVGQRVQVRPEFKRDGDFCRGANNNPCRHTALGVTDE